MIYENGFVNKAMHFYKSDTKKIEFSINKFSGRKTIAYQITSSVFTPDEVKEYSKDALVLYPCNLL